MVRPNDKLFVIDVGMSSLDQAAAGTGANHQFAQTDVSRVPCGDMENKLESHYDSCFNSPPRSPTSVSIRNTIPMKTAERKP